MGKLAAAAAFALLFPYAVTLAWTGSVEGEKNDPEAGEERRILLDRGDTPAYMGLEDYLPGVLAVQIPADREMEALKAQAVIARTYICSRMGEEREIPESALDLDYLDSGQLAELWGDQAAEYYGRLEQAAEETAGTVITWEGELIEPLFHRVSAGSTRSGGEGYPYLEAAECPEDRLADGYLQAVPFSREEFAERIREIPESGEVSAGDLPQGIQILRADGAGYVEEIQIGTGSYTGEEVQYALDLASPSFTVEEYDGGLRVITRGVGHGYGLSQQEAERMAENGSSAEEILQYFYKNISLNSV